ncbi:DUF551 domain-containing protein [Kosakonia quasisacchari]|uniref:DUF551 domain-containing protein n=1 Tax=Kosakonia quasisacchari TaxID=2529380 RepID=A0A4V2LZW8_9ENTR|nr:DUF551 domain-containing protein [Kosakonia quasisacchari]TCC09586.1 DUF551 domain-containing protein [Kosakonia quasisacchari]
MTAQLSREELKQSLIECSQNASGMFEVGEDTMCAMVGLLEGMSSEPVAWECKGILCHTLEQAQLYIGNPEPLYAAPPALVDDEWYSALQEMVNAMIAYEMDVGEPAPYKHRKMMMRAGHLLESHRTAMLKAEPVTAATVPDWWKLVPVEPTQEMIDAHVEGVQTGGMQKGYRAMLAAAPAAPTGWIKCSDRMPDEGVRVLVYDRSENEQYVAWYSFGCWAYGVSHDCNLECYPTHWMPLPAAPEQEV